MKRRAITLIGICVIITGAAISTYVVLRSSTTSRQPAPALAPDAVVASLPKKDASGIDTSHLADGIAPPTNKWFSGIALQATPKTVFPTPLSFTPTENSFTVDLPSVATTEKSILSSPSSPLTVTVSDAQFYRITRYDEMSVDLTYYNNATIALATVTITAGSPYVFVYGLEAVDLTFGGESSSIAVKAFASANMTTSGASIPTDGFVTFYGSPSSQERTLLETTAGNRISGGSVSYQKTGDAYETYLAVTTSNRQPTTYGLLPHQTTSQSPVFTIDTLYGSQQFIQDSNFHFTTPSIPVTDKLDLTRLSATDRQLLVTQLRHDINATQMTAEDTYFGGKQLYRSAQLLQLAHQLDEPAIASTIQQKLHRELTLWLKQSDGRAKKFFYYDTKIRGIVGETPSFGSDEFNDHHFHYGYFIYAASILAKYDHEFKQQYQPMVDLLVADVANYSTTEQLPLRRNFDPYFGHSWASGSAPFNDGNNQESASEAMNAWIGISLWATQTNNAPLRSQADWILSNEVATTYAYWLNFDQTKAPYNQTFNHAISPLNWGGKRDYATFFSGEPSAMLGILLIPMSPTMTQFDTLGSRIDTVVTEAGGAATDKAQFADYILMLSSLNDPAGKVDRAKLLDDTVIDNANSRSYLYAWILSATR